ncbi:hypothetical protein NRIC_16470 [Enterococcus florum]|uniref:PTS beta-glucoside transporter subunit EIIBCA n=1 Tax=Enterococcus florum TaxID=2480627 RepID=A0A4P5P8A3_9ENTE|nr:PTS transporter subunit EIIC [Enterococcus florum]GCF93756.1 hypothetical protein NRIC_16470 [Enterococcus florum]
MAKQDKFSELAKSLPQYIGGKENVGYFTHCVTRLRFNLKDRSLVNIEEIEKLPAVVGVQWSGEQLQIIIGQTVGDAYKAIASELGIKQEDPIDENLDKNTKFSFNNILDGIAGCVTPLIPLLIGAGMIKVVVLILQVTGVMAETSPTLSVLTFAADAGFYFLPILVGATAAKKFGANIGLGMLMGAMLLHPTFTGMVAEGTKVSFLSIPVLGASYANMVFPSIISVFILSKVQRFFGKHSPDALRSLLEPLLSLLIMIPLTLCLLAPIGSYLGTFLTDGILWIYNTIGFLGVALLSCLWPLLVLTGMHTTVTPYLVQTMATVGYDPIVIVSSFLANFCQGAACLAVSLRSKDQNLKANALSSAITAILGGVTEPALFGVTLKLKKPLWAVLIGGFCGGAVAGLFKVYVYAFVGSGGVFGLPALIGEKPMNLIYMIISIVVAMVVTFVSTLILYKEESATKEESGKINNDQKLVSE